MHECWSHKSRNTLSVTGLPQILHHNRQVVWGIFLFWVLQAWLGSEVLKCNSFAEISTCPSRLHDASLHIHIHASTCQLCYHVGVTSVKVSISKPLKKIAASALEFAALRFREKHLNFLSHGGVLHDLTNLVTLNSQQIHTIDQVKIASAARNWINVAPQKDGMTFAFASLSILLFWMESTPRSSLIAPTFAL